MLLRFLLLFETSFGGIDKADPDKCHKEWGERGVLSTCKDKGMSNDDFLDKTAWRTDKDGVELPEEEMYENLRRMCTCFCYDHIDHYVENRKTSSRFRLENEVEGDWIENEYEEEEEESANDTWALFDTEALNTEALGEFQCNDNYAASDAYSYPEAYPPKRHRRAAIANLGHLEMKVDKNGNKVPEWDPTLDPDDNGAYRDKYRCEYPMMKWNITETVEEETKFIVPYSIHWTVPPCAWEVIHMAYEDLNRQMGCVKFHHVKDPMKKGGVEEEKIKNEWKFGIMIMWESQSSSPWCRTNGQSAQASEADYDKKNYKYHYGGPLDYTKDWADALGLTWGPENAYKYDKDRDDGDRPHMFKMLHMYKDKKIWRRSSKSKYDQMPFNWQALHMAGACFKAATLKHESIHMLGFAHDQAAPDRDNFLKVSYENMKYDSKGASNYKRMNPDGEAISPYPLELESTMAYGTKLKYCYPKGGNKADKCKCKYYSEKFDDDPDACKNACTCSTITQQEYDRLDERGYKGLHRFLTLNDKYMEGNDRTLWRKNGVLTTTDILSIDWFYCRPFSIYNTHNQKNYDKSKDDYLNEDFIERDMVNCIHPDRIDIIRPIFKSRLCDGIADCFHGEDEDGSLLTCDVSKDKFTWVATLKDELPWKTITNTCPEVIILASDKVQKCEGKWENLSWDNDLYYWNCERIDDPTTNTERGHSEIRFIHEKTIETEKSDADYLLESTKFASYMKTSGKETFSGFVILKYSDEYKNVEGIETIYDKIIAFHPIDVSNEDNDWCPPVGKWEFNDDGMYERIRSYPNQNKHYAISADPLKNAMFESSAAKVTVCGATDSNVNGVYQPDDDDFVPFRGIFKKTDNSGGEFEISLDEQNQFWTIGNTNSKKIMFHSKGIQNYTEDQTSVRTVALVNGENYFTESGKYIGVNPHWYQAMPEAGSYPPGHSGSNLTEWKDAPLWFGVVPTETSCPQFNNLLRTIYLCNRNAEKYWKVHGKYELRFFDNNGFPYYVFVGERSQMNGVKNFEPRIYWNPEAVQWEVRSCPKPNPFATGWTGHSCFWNIAELPLLKKSGKLDDDASEWLILKTKEEDNYEAAMIEISDSGCCEVFEYDPADPSKGVIADPVTSAKATYWNPTVYLCGGFAQSNADGKYDLVPGETTNGLPYYKSTPNSMNKNEAKVLYWDFDKNSWIISSEEHLGTGIGIYFKRGRDFLGQGWKISPIELEAFVPSAEQESDWPESKMISSHVAECPNYEDLPVLLYIAQKRGETSPISIGGKYMFNNEFVDFPYYFRQTDEFDDPVKEEEKYFIYWNADEGSWIVGWELGSKSGWLYSPSWQLERTKWTKNNFAEFYTAASSWLNFYISTANLLQDNLPRFGVFGCSGEIQANPYSFIVFVRYEPTHDGAPYYIGSTTLGDLYLYWQAGYWTLSSSMDNSRGYFKQRKMRLQLEYGAKWAVVENLAVESDVNAHSEWIESSFFLSSSNECKTDNSHLEMTSTTSAPTTTIETSTFMVTGPQHHVVCPPEGAIQVMGEAGVGATVQFHGEQDVVVKVNLFNTFDFDIWTNEYLGFVTLTDEKCSTSILNGFHQDRIKWSIVDKGSFYSAQFKFARSNPNSVTLQFHRHKHSHPEDLGSTDKDEFYLIFNGLMNFNLHEAELEDCFARFTVRVLELNANLSGEEDLTQCAAYAQYPPSP